MGFFSAIFKQLKSRFGVLFHEESVEGGCQIWSFIFRRCVVVKFINDVAPRDFADKTF